MTSFVTKGVTKGVTKEVTMESATRVVSKRHIQKAQARRLVALVNTRARKIVERKAASCETCPASLICAAAGGPGRAEAEACVDDSERRKNDLRRSYLMFQTCDCRHCGKKYVGFPRWDKELFEVSPGCKIVSLFAGWQYRDNRYADGYMVLHSNICFVCYKEKKSRDQYGIHIRRKRKLNRKWEKKFLRDKKAKERKTER